MNILNGLFGIVIIIGIGYLMSNNKSKINWRTIGIGLGLQMFLACAFLTDYAVFIPFKWFVNFLSEQFVWVISFAVEGSKLIFGPLANQAAMQKIFPNSGGFVFAFMALTTIIFFGSLMAVLYYFGIMQIVIKFMAKIMVKLLRVSGAEAISVAANVFVGQTEAPLVIKPYVEKMTKSEIATLMIGGMATIAGGVMAVYISILGGPEQASQIAVATRLLTASLMAAPATILIAKLFVPETEHSVTYGKVELEVEKNGSNVIEAAANGASEGMQLALNVAAMLLAFTAIIALVNSGTEKILTDLLGLTINGEPITVSSLVGYMFSVFGFVIGVPTQDVVAFGSMLGQKFILNEFFAYFTLSQIQSTLSAKTVFLSTFAFCGFANLSSIAIQIGGIGGIAPSKKSQLALFGLKAVIGGSLATLLTAAIAGMFF